MVCRTCNEIYCRCYWACTVCSEDAYITLIQINPEDRSEQDTEYFCSIQCLKWAYD